MSCSYEKGRQMGKKIVHRKLPHGVPPEKYYPYYGALDIEMKPGTRHRTGVCLFCKGHLQITQESYTHTGYSQGFAHKLCSRMALKEARGLHGAKETFRGLSYKTLPYESGLDWGVGPTPTRVEVR